MSALGRPLPPFHLQLINTHAHTQRQKKLIDLGYSQRKTMYNKAAQLCFSQFPLAHVISFAMNSTD